MLAEFEEKQYEHYMNFELLCKHNILNLFPPGQHLEHYLGFDVALYSCNHKFWKYFKDLWRWYNYYYYRIFNKFPYIKPEDVRFFEELLGKYLNYIPKIKFNLFIQYKRPEYLTSNRSKEWIYWKKPYYRYHIINHQQQLLKNLALNIDRHSALVIYASPAFHTQKQLWENVQRKTIIDNSNYCKVTDLSGHMKYTYINGGKYGIALSEPEKIENLNFEKSIGNFKEESRYENNIYTVINLANQVENSIEKSSYSEYYKYYLMILKNKFFWEFRYKYRIFYSFIKLSLFEQITGVRIFYGF